MNLQSDSVSNILTSNNLESELDKIAHGTYIMKTSFQSPSIVLRYVEKIVIYLSMIGHNYYGHYFHAENFIMRIIMSMKT